MFKEIGDNTQIVLNIPEPEDIDFIFNIENNQEYWTFGETVVPFSRDFIARYVYSNLENRIDSENQLRFIIKLKKDGLCQAIGTLDLFEYQARNRNAQVGILIEKEYQKQGYGKHAMDLLIDYAKNHLALHQLFCETSDDNKKSQDFFTSLGFSLCGKRKEWLFRNGRWIDLLEYQLLF